jgi:Zn-dependent M28 family amino/carboxypeptidase
MAHLLCGKRGRYAVWIAFFDGEEAQKQWSDLDSLYGSREMAARMALSGDLKDVRAMLLADIVGGKNLRILREPSSTPWLTDLIWSTADRLGYKKYFLDQDGGAEDDHDSFLKRGVPAVDVINDFPHLGYWHTPQDTMDKISAKSLAIVGHVFVETLKELQEK